MRKKRPDLIPPWEQSVVQELAEQINAQASACLLESQKSAEAKSQACLPDPEPETPEQLFLRGQAAYYAEDFTTAWSCFTQAAEQGHAQAQYWKGDSYWLPWGEEKNNAKMVHWYIKAAKQGEPNAQLGLGTSYECGMGVQKDFTKALYWYTKAAEQGCDCAQNTLGVCYEHGDIVQRDLTKAVYWYTKAAEQGEPYAQDNLGGCYEYGVGVQKDMVRAAYWYTKAAKQGNDAAQYRLGSCYKNGEGVQRDLTKAVYWYTKAAELRQSCALSNLNDCYEMVDGAAGEIQRLARIAEHGGSAAQYLLGAIYHQGIDVPVSLSKAHYWYTRAAERGNGAAKDALSRLSRWLLQHGEEAYSRKDYFTAAEDFAKAAEQGNPDAQYKLAICYENGQGIPVNIDRAIDWYAMAAKQDDPRAVQALKRLSKTAASPEQLFWVVETLRRLKTGEAPLASSEQLYQKGLDAYRARYYTRAAEQGHPEAQFKLGVCYEHGDGVGPDSVICSNGAKAIYWYTKAAEQGYAPARNALRKDPNKVIEAQLFELPFL